jgi:hypothetical protein
VEGGENVGIRMQHDFVVLKYASAPLTLQREGYRGKVPLSEKTSQSVETLAIAIWVTEEGSVFPVQAAGGIIPRYVKDEVALT